jgi:hypothetical protein
MWREWVGNINNFRPTQICYIISTLSLSILTGKQEQKKKDKHTGYTTDAYLMKLNSTTACKGHKEPLSFHTSAIAYLMKWFNFNYKNYLTHNECLSRQMKYEEPCKAAALLRFQPTVNMK